MPSELVLWALKLNCRVCQATGWGAWSGRVTGSLPAEAERLLGETVVHVLSNNGKPQ